MPRDDLPLNACSKSVIATKIRDDGRPYAGVFPCDCLGFEPLNAPTTSRICAQCGHYRVNHYHKPERPLAMPGGLAQQHVNQFAEAHGQPRPYPNPE